MASKKKKKVRARQGMHRTTIELTKAQWSFLERYSKRLSKRLGTPTTPVQGLRALLEGEIRKEKEEAA